MLGMSIKVGVRNRLEAYRNPVYLLYALVGVVVFVLSALVAGNGVGPVELSVFRFFNSLGQPLNNFFQFISWFGTIGMLVIVALIALIRRHYANAIKIFVGGVSAYFLALALKGLEIRARPYVILDNVNVREHTTSAWGFPSGHAAVATVLAITAYQYLPKRWHRPVTILAALVLISRMYLGVHLPMDLVGGFAVGLFCGGLVNFLLGSRHFSPVPSAKLKKSLLRLSIPVQTVKLAAVDARGSTPYMATLKDGSSIFVKVVGRENNIADWFFKSWRKIIYRRLEDETPFLNAKRQLEHEAYISNLALIAGVRTPRVLAVFSVPGGRWGHAQVAIAGKSLDKVEPKLITDKVIESVWEQVNIMHAAGIVHRDLRCANVFLDAKGVPWMIDFGFSEAAMPEESKDRDRAELLASMATLVGAERSVRAAKKMLTAKKLKATAAYLSYSVLSSATTSNLKKQSDLLPEIREQVAKQLHTPKPKLVKMKRLDLKSLLILVVVAIGVFVILPKLSGFRESLSAIRGARLELVGLALLFSLLTYYFAALSYLALLFYPISQVRLLLIQAASSFTSKLAPGGAGGLALNARFLAKNNHSAAQSGAIAAMNTFLGLVGHTLILVFVLIFGDSSLRQSFHLRDSLPVIICILIGCFILLIVLGLITFPSIRKRVAEVIKGFGRIIGDYRHHYYRIVGCVIASMLVTLAYCGALYACAHALGSSLNMLQIVVVFTVGTAAASITPTPGGIGGAEAGLLAALVATGTSSDLALSITLIYRLITYWLPIIPGFISFRYALKKSYI